jgi:hypothetical protein
VVVVRDMRWLMHEICRFVLIHGVGYRALVEVNPNLGFFSISIRVCGGALKSQGNATLFFHACS